MEVDEGNDRTTRRRHPEALSEPVTGDVTIALAFHRYRARLGSDFDLAGTEVIVAAGRTQAATTITPIRDLEAEGDEIVSLEIESIAGRGEIGSIPSVDIVIRDLGAPPEGEYAAFLAILLARILKPIEDQTPSTLPSWVFNNGTAAAVLLPRPYSGDRGGRRALGEELASLSVQRTGAERRVRRHDPGPLWRA